MLSTTALGLHFLSNVVDLVRFTGALRFVCQYCSNMTKILFLQKSEVLIGFDYLFAIYKHQSV